MRREFPIPGIPVQPMPRARPPAIRERSAVDKKQVRPAVVVVVEDDGASSHRLRHVLLGARAVFVFERDTANFPPR